jgi:AhpD family alkylhydroperoxidase
MAGERGMTENEETWVEGEEKFYNEYLRLVREKGDEAVEESLEALQKIYGAPPLVARVLSENKDYFLSSVIKNRAILHRPDGPLDQKTTELVVIAAAAALRCEHCLEVHIEQAIKNGATKEEILHTIMIACAIAETSGWATAFRKYRQVTAKMQSAKEGGDVK